MTKGEKLARWYGVSHRVGHAMCYSILTVAGTLISRTTVRSVTDEELRKPDVREQMHNCKLKLNESLKITSEVTSVPSSSMSHRTRSYGTLVGSEAISEVIFKDALSFNLKLCICSRTSGFLIIHL